MTQRIFREYKCPKSGGPFWGHQLTILDTPSADVNNSIVYVANKY